jgi:hypothetical protein
VAGRAGRQRKVRATGQWQVDEEPHRQGRTLGALRSPVQGKIAVGNASLVMPRVWRLSVSAAL